MLELIQTSPLAFLVIIGGLIIALAFHEAAHAFVAYKLGDSTAKMAGRLTINPLKHLDPFGTLALIFFRFGWGKPVPVNPRNFKNPAVGNLLVALAGPATNILIALVLGGITFLLPPNSLLTLVISTVVYINILLAFFNLLPIPPLDGSKILGLFLSEESAYELERIGPMILLVFILLVNTTSSTLLLQFLNLVNRLTNLITAF
ncbi:MAG TPA: site-2 protease family protein [bacterium]|nr:site-2 protease family protein [bacterium]HOR57116.1 site-2 protease family protein [bacterium]HPL56368.1 site-2 protease family protein [bacterium]